MVIASGAIASGAIGGLPLVIGGSGTQELTPSLVTNTQTFHSATVSQGGVTLQPSLVTNTQTFFGSTVSVGSVTLSPSLLTNGQTFFAPTVANIGGSQSLTPDLFTNEQTFYSATVSTLTLTQADLDAIAAAVWADPTAVAAHAKLDAIIARLTC